MMGCTISLIALTVIGRFHLVDLGYALVLIVGIGLGMWCAPPLRSYIDRHTARPFLLGLCAISSLLVLGRALLM